MVAEKGLDGLLLLAVLAVVMPLMPLPSWLGRAALWLSAALALL